MGPNTTSVRSLHIDMALRRRHYALRPGHHRAVPRLSREGLPIGQFGSIVKVHFGRRIIYALLNRLRMKAEYEAERGAVPSSSSDERIVEADLFGEGEWIQDSTAAVGAEWSLWFDRGVSTYPLSQQTIYMTPKAELRILYQHKQHQAIVLGEHVGAGGAPCFAHLNELLGKHTAILGSTGAGNQPNRKKAGSMA